MAFWDFLRNVGTAPVESPNLSYALMEPRVEYVTGPEWAEEVAAIWSGVRSMTPAEMWKTQPHLRTVVGFVGRNVAQLGVHVFERLDETDRRRDRTNAFSRALAAPGDGMTRYRLLYALTVDKMLHDRAYWIPWTDEDGLPRIRRIPPSWVTPKDSTPFGISSYWLTLPNGRTEIAADRMIVFGGYASTSLTGSSPTIEALKETLGEQIEASKYRAQVWKRGGRTSSVITRPAGVKWSPEAADRFREDWYAQYTGDGPRAGGTPILEDGMDIKTIDFSALDMQWAEGQTISFSTVASAFHVNPTMVGILDNANYSNVREFRRMLYGDTLGPYIADFEDVINAFALPFFGVDTETRYAEFNIGEKLQGSFEEQAAVLSSAVGAPWMLRDEARAKLNMPALGGDAAELVTPLNVLVGGMASPRDTGTQNEDPTADPEAPRSGALPARKAVSVKARAPETFEAKVSQVIGGFFDRQARVVKTALGVKAGGDWWDEARWDRELARDLNAVALLVTKEVAGSTLSAIGFEPDTYDEPRTHAWLAEVSRRSASSLNATTKAKLDAALDDDDPAAALAGVFAAQESRAASVAASTVTMLSGFATVEATKQAVGEEAATKTWATGPNARPDHAALDGETVALSDNFSNGAAWPGDGANLGADDLAGCNCELVINVP